MKRIIPFIFALVILACQQHPGIWTNPVDDMDFVKIPAGNLNAFMTAVDKSDSVIIVNISEFRMSVTETSVAQFAKFVQETGYVTSAEKDSNRFTWRNPGFAQEENHPVVFVSYEDANAYCQWADVDLPTQEEWIHALRAGTNSKYYWGDSLYDDYLWNRRNTKGISTQPVGTLQPNPWGLYNMAGNVREYAVVCDVRYVVKGTSWTRCPSYLLRQGYVASDMIANALKPQLFECRKLKYGPYPYDDDRGFRCVKR